MNLVNLTGKMVAIADNDGNVIQRLEPVNRKTVRPALEFEGRPDDAPETYGTFDPDRLIRDCAISHIRGLPENEQEGTIYIVGTSTAMASSLIFERDDVVTPDLGMSAIRDDRGRVIAVRRFMRYVDSVERPAGGITTSLGDAR